MRQIRAREVSDKRQGKIPHLFLMQREDLESMAYIPFEKRYHDVAVPALQKEFGYKNKHQIPYVERAVLNVGVGRMMGQKTVVGARADEALKDVMKALEQISGQRPAVIESKKSIAGFKLRAGMITGLKVTLRHKRMQDFYDRFVNIALPRTRDFRGIKRRNVDDHGNLTIGLKEQAIFPELMESNAVFGLEVTFVTTAKTAKESTLLFEQMGMPFQKEEA